MITIIVDLMWNSIGFICGKILLEFLEVFERSTVYAT
jgi:hypothetical protein